ncbi:MAG: hypothetical protein Q9170_004868 [Blastenia crenularia]
MIRSGVMTVLACLVSLLIQDILAAPAYGSTGSGRSPQRLLYHRNSESPLVLKSVINTRTWKDSGFNPAGSQPNDTYPMGNPFSNSTTPPYHTFTNGPNWMEYLTFKYNQSRVDTYNLAVSGSSVNNTILGVESPADLIHQISDRFVPNYVLKHLSGWTSSNSLFSLFFGINDVNRSWSKRDSKINDAVFTSYLKLLNALYNFGARNFLLHDVPPIDRGPYVTKPDAAVEGPDINDFNYRMTRLFASFTTQHRDVTVILFNTNSLFSRVIDNPSVFPQTAIYKNTTGSCKAYETGEVPSMDYFNSTCQYPVNEYLWLNGLHPTYPIHEALAAQVAIALAR